MSYPGTKTPTKPAGVAKWHVPKRKTESCYGQPAEEWCKNVYEYTCKRCEVAFKNFNEYAESINCSKNIL